MKKLLVCAAMCATAAVPSFVSAMDMNTAVSEALKNNFDIKASSYQAEAQKFSAEAYKSAYYPQADASYSYADSSEKAYNKFLTDKYSSIGATISYNLFNGFTDKYNYLAAEKSYSAEKYNAEAVKQDIVLNVKQAYISVLKASDGVTVAAEAVKLLEDQLKDTRLFFKAGLKARNDVLKVESELASARQSQMSAQTTYKTAVFNLEKLTGTTLEDGEQFADLPDGNGQTGDFKSLRADMIGNRSELKYLLDQADANDLSRKAILGGYLPKINVSAGHYSYGQDYEPADRKHMYDNETVVSASVSVNLFDGFKKAKQTSAKDAEKTALIYKIKNTEASMDLQLKTALENLDLAKNSMAAAQSEVDSAKENYRITQDQFRQQVATNTDLMDARVMLTRAETDYNNARHSVQSALADIDRIVERK